MTHVLGIDPGCTDSAFALIDAETRRPLSPVHIGKTDNADLRSKLNDCTLAADLVAIEMIASYGMPVGAEVFETCVWIGRFFEVSAVTPQLVYRRDVKLHHCGSSRANDANVTQALIDRFAPGVPNKGKGTKAAPGWFYGFRADIWQAYALAVEVADRHTMAVA